MSILFRKSAFDRVGVEEVIPTGRGAFPLTRGCDILPEVRPLSKISMGACLENYLSLNPRASLPKGQWVDCAP